MLGAGMCGGYRLGGHRVRDALGTIAGGVWTTSSRSWCLSLGWRGATENSDLCFRKVPLEAGRKVGLSGSMGCRRTP